MVVEAAAPVVLLVTVGPGIQVLPWSSATDATVPLLLKRTPRIKQFPAPAGFGSRTARLVTGFWSIALATCCTSVGVAASVVPAESSRSSATVNATVCPPRTVNGWLGLRFMIPRPPYGVTVRTAALGVPSMAPLEGLLKLRFIVSGV